MLINQLILDDMDTIELEKYLIEKFKAEFHEKLGYYPIVVTDKAFDRSKKLMSLSDLEQLFEDLLPSLYGNKIKLSSRKRNRSIVELRIIYVYLARCMGYRLIDIAAHLKKHHASIIHYEEQFGNLMSTSLEFRRLYDDVLTHVSDNHKSDDELSTMVYFNKIQHKSKSIILSGLLPIQD